MRPGVNVADPVEKNPMVPTTMVKPTLDGTDFVHCA